MIPIMTHYPIKGSQRFDAIGFHSCRKTILVVPTNEWSLSSKRGQEIVVSLNCGFKVVVSPPSLPTPLFPFSIEHKGYYLIGFIGF